MTVEARWIDPIGGDPADRTAGPVMAALLTTFEPPDATLLVEELLPRWFDLDRESSSDERDNRFFLAELESALQRRRGQLCVFSSNAPHEQVRRHWLWSHVVPHRVGFRGSAVQHAKLWLLLRVNASGAESLEVHVSSTNLTGPAVRDQVQSGVRFRIPMQSRRTSVALGSWGCLGPFLSELGRHSGPAGHDAVKPWLERLGRCRAPEEMAFVASVPGTHAGSAWGARALGAALDLPSPSEVDILVPTVGSWTGKQLEHWAQAVGTTAGHVGLAWIRKDHPWARFWAMPPNTHRSLKRECVTLLDLGKAESDQRRRLHRDFGEEDSRWPHAKLYWFARRKRSFVLVTSANWSTSAWGAPAAGNRISIRNFELGVLMDAKDRPLQRLTDLRDPPATSKVEEEFAGASAWLYASFDGARLRVLARTSQAIPQRAIAIDADNQAVVLRCSWKRSGDHWEWTARTRWRSPPAHVELKIGGATCSIPVHDLRTQPLAEVAPLSRPPGFGAEELAEIRAALLEEHYGGGVIDDGTPGGAGGEDSVDGDSQSLGASYGVYALEQARRLSAVVDAWQSALNEAASEAAIASIRKDGETLLRSWSRELRQGNGRRQVALKVVSTELRLRLEAMT